MPREVDDKKTRKALRRLARAKRTAEQSDTPDAQLSEWEDEFIGSLEERLDKFGSAFNDPDKGSLDDALSARQSLKLREIEKKAKGKERKPMSRGNGFKRKTPSRGGRSRDINDDVIAPVADEAMPPQPPVAPDEEPTPAPPAAKGFKPVIIEGGKLKT